MILIYGAFELFIYLILLLMILKLGAMTLGFIAEAINLFIWVYNKSFKMNVEYINTDANFQF